jgi:hypothetical protein
MMVVSGIDSCKGNVFFLRFQLLPLFPAMFVRGVKDILYRFFLWKMFFQAFILHALMQIPIYQCVARESSILSVHGVL